MSKHYIVSKGDCITSIAFEHGFHPATLWNHPQNSKVREDRLEGTVLKDGDRIFIPDLEIKHVSKATDAEHIFRRKGIPEILRIRFLDDAGLPRANRRYILTIDGKLRDGKTDSDGYLKVSIAPNAAHARLLLYENTEDNVAEEYNFNLGYLQPITELAGVKARLVHLGYTCGGAAKTETDDSFRDALLAFQTDNKLEGTGELNDPTRNRIREVYGA